MPRRMTIVFDDEELYTTLKVAAARAHRPAKDIVAEALEIFFEATDGERDGVLARARMRAYARRGGPAVTDLLKELGLRREPAAADA